VTTPKTVTEDQFAVIYRELAKAEGESPAVSVRFTAPELDPSELQAIDELRRFAMEVANPKAAFFTGT
jgi:hypothetical protein